MKAISLIRKAAGYVGGMGVRGTLAKLRLRLATHAMYQKARVAPYTDARIRARRAQAQDLGEILVNADVRGMDDAMIARLRDSLLAQTYPNWRLCLVGAQAEGQADARIFAAQAECESGEYIALLAPGCTLHPCALQDAVQALHTQGAGLVYTDETDENGCGLYKPDYGAYTLRSIDYIGGFAAVRWDVVKAAGGLGGGDAHARWLRLAQAAGQVAHVPQALCTRHMPLCAHRQAHVCAQAGKSRGLVSILIPNKDHSGDLMRCIDSLREKTTYPDWEIIIIENNSVEQATFDCYEALKQDPRIRVVVWDKGFNYAAINNYGETFARGTYLLLLNNDVEIITPNWLEEMVDLAAQADVGAVGAMLYYPDDTVQHAGVIVGVGDVAGHAFRGSRRGDAGYMDMLTVVRNVSAVTAACLLMRRDVYRRIGGMDEGYAVAYNDVDMCMRIGEAGYAIVFTPHAQLYHYESRSRGLDTTAQKFMRYAGEVDRFHARWRSFLEQGDPYHNGNLSKRREDFGV